jgi:hypothetical protein
MLGLRVDEGLIHEPGRVYIIEGFESTLSTSPTRNINLLTASTPAKIGVALDLAILASCYDQTIKLVLG